MIQNMMRAAVVVALTCPSFAAQVTSVWRGGASATTPLTAVNWNDANNWDANGVPNGPEAIASFGTIGTVFYVTSTEPVSVWSQKAGDAAGLVYISEEKFSICNKTDISPKGGHFYAPVEFSHASVATYFSQARFCDVMTAAGPKNALVNGRVFYHLDRFARIPGEVRREDLDFSVSGFNAHLDIHAPESSATDVTCAFEQIAGSAYLRRVGGDLSTVLSVGTEVTGAGIPQGTFLRRVFPDKAWIELSRPVTADSAANPLTFAAFTPDLTLSIKAFKPNNAGTRCFLRPCKYRPEDNFTVDVGNIGLLGIYSTGNDQAVVFDVPYGTKVNSPTTLTGIDDAKFDVPYDAALYPARIVIHGSGSVSRGNVLLADCDLLFSDNPVGSRVPGFSRGVVAQLPVSVRNNRSYDESKLTVTGEMTAVIHELKGIVRTLGKYGSGTLIVGMTNAVPSTGTIAVREGTFQIADPGEGNIYYCAASDDPVEIGSLEISTGATFVVPARGVRVRDSFSFGTGAIIAGDGALTLPGSVRLEDVTFKGNARVVFDGVRLVGTGAHSQVPGNPAFWVDCSQTNTMTLVETNGEWGVQRINDVRKKSAGDGYNYSEAVGGFLPRLHYDAISGKHFVYFLGNWKTFAYGDSISLADCDTHAWHTPVQNIRAVFQVMSQLRAGNNEKNLYGIATMVRGGGFLGACYPATNPGNDNTWGRYSVAYSSPVVQTGWGPASVMNGRWYFNGLDVADYTAGYPYESYVDGGTIQLVPETIGYEAPAGVTGPSASSYDHNRQYQNQNKNGNKILCELLVYTTDVSETDRKQIMSYLMKKWQNAEIIVKDFQDDGNSLGTLSGTTSAAVEVAANSGVLLDELSGSATLVKSGEGRLLVDVIKGTTASLEVRGGVVEIESRSPDSLPVTEGVFAHFDANDPDSVVCARGDDKVTAWTDASGLKTALLDASSTTPPTLVAKAALGGKKVVDFGAATSAAGGMVDWTTSPALILPEEQRSTKLRTIIALWGSEHGGGSLVGGATGPEMKWSTRYTLARGGDAAGILGADATASIVDTKMPIPYTCQLPKAVDFRLNGEVCRPTETGLSGGFDVVSYAGYETFGMGGLSGVFGNNKFYSNVYYVGGEQFGEYIAYERKLAPSEVEAVEAYLKHKWFGSDVEGLEASAFKALTVVSGALLKVSGNAPVTVSETLGCAGGQVDGSLVLAEGVSLAATVDAMGRVQGLTVSGGLGFPRTGGTIELVGELNALQPGVYTLLSANTPITSVADWSVSARGVPRHFAYSLAVRDGRLVLNVAIPGTVIIMR